MSPWLQVADKQASWHSHLRVIRNKKKISVSHTERGETGKWVIHSTCMELNEHACVSLEECIIFTALWPSISSFCLLADPSCNWPVTVRVRCYISHFGNGVNLPVRLYWYTEQKRKKQKQKPAHYVLCIFLCVRSYKYSPTESPSKTFSMCLIMASRSLSWHTQGHTRRGHTFSLKHTICSLWPTYWDIIILVEITGLRECLLFRSTP